MLTLGEVHKLSPLMQFVVLAVPSMVLIVVFGIFSRDQESVYKVACTSWLLFAWLNPIISVFSVKWWKYMIQSLIVFALLGFSLLSLSSFFSELSLAEMLEYQLSIQATVVFYVTATIVSGIFCAILSLVTDL